MAQFDLLLTQNVAAAGTEFSEKYINIGKGGLLSGATDGTPTVLPAGTNGYQLIRDDASPTGLKWVAVTGGHTQGTDVGTTSNIFELDTDGFKVELTAESATKLGVKVDGGATYADLQAKDATFNKVTIASLPSVGTDATNKNYVDGLLSANDAMVYKGTIGVGGTIEIAAFNTLAIYQAGYTYKVITAGTIKGKVCEIGDMLIATVDREGSGQVDGDWTVVQTNVDGVVTGAASSVADAIPLFNGTTGKIIKDSGKTIVTTLGSTDATLPTSKAVLDMTNTLVPKSAFTATDAILVGSGVGAYTPLIPTASTFVGKKATGGVGAISATEARAILNVADGANNYVHPNHTGDVTSVAGGATTIAAKAVTLAKMADMATGSIFYRKTAGTGAPEVQTLATLKADLVSMPAEWKTAPASKTATGTAGMIARDGNFFYICTATNIWKRSAIATNW